MAEILVGSQSPVTHKVFWNGDVANATSAPVVKIYDVTNDPAVSPAVLPTTLLTTITSTLDENNPGTYTVNVPYAYTDRNRTLSVRFFRKDLVDVNVVPEIGDAILWNEDYYEVDNLVENQLILGKDPSYPYSDTVDDFGTSLSIIVEAHYTRPEKLGIKEQRL